MEKAEREETNSVKTAGKSSRTIDKKMRLIKQIQQFEQFEEKRVPNIGITSIVKKRQSSMPIIVFRKAYVVLAEMLETVLNIRLETSDNDIKSAFDVAVCHN